MKSRFLKEASSRICLYWTHLKTKNLSASIVTADARSSFMPKESMSAKCIIRSVDDAGECNDGMPDS